MAAGAAVVDVMAVDAWEQTRAAVVGWWRRVRPEQADSVELELDRSRDRVLAARPIEDTVTQQAVVDEWSARLHNLVADDPVRVAALRRLLDEELLPALLASRDRAGGPTVMKATASGHGRVYQAGRDQHITER
ncbi:hypothetical protein ACFO3J_18285 [Streptomyces polygonati]|uniref:Uncharacterized protein n=1 Tax=Streptomyces polygonati TaxID=1617087 RepID=A0ABV8HRC3_9ACTN